LEKDVRNIVMSCLERTQAVFAGNQCFANTNAPCALACLISCAGSHFPGMDAMVSTFCGKCLKNASRYRIVVYYMLGTALDQVNGYLLGVLCWLTNLAQITVWQI